MAFVVGLLRAMSAKRRKPFFGCCLCSLVFLLGVVLPASTPPLWWRKGRARKILGSRAEAELLSQLAVLLMPDEPIAEGFRSFPCKRSKDDWGCNENELSEVGKHINVIVAPMQGFRKGPRDPPRSSTCGTPKP